jgi:hypothetical protein
LADDSTDDSADDSTDVEAVLRFESDRGAISDRRNSRTVGVVGAVAVAAGTAASTLPGSATARREFDPTPRAGTCAAAEGVTASETEAVSATDSECTNQDSSPLRGTIYLLQT